MSTPTSPGKAMMETAAHAPTTPPRTAVSNGRNTPQSRGRQKPNVMFDEPPRTPTSAAKGHGGPVRAIVNSMRLENGDERTPRAMKPIETPLKDKAMDATATLAENMKLLSTPRKQIQTTPSKRTATPKQSLTPTRARTYLKSASPSKHVSAQKVVRIRDEPLVLPEDADPSASDGAMGSRTTSGKLQPTVERVHLQDFLNTTSIRFMDLTTTKRRHTILPSANIEESNRQRTKRS